jgi:SMP-30/Gluconolactonase/LRE-like region/NHL repeat/FG-GAP-like repeat
MSQVSPMPVSVRRRAFFCFAFLVVALLGMSTWAAAQQIPTLAGRSPAGLNDGTGSEAAFNVPTGLAVDAAGNLYVVDQMNCAIRKVTPAGVVTTFAGLGDGDCGGDDGTGIDASFFWPGAIAVDGGGTFYIAETGNNSIRKITSAGVVTTFAGQPGTFGSADGTGTAARFSGPRGIAVDAAGNVYVGDSFNHTIRKISAAGVVTTLAGSPGVAGAVDATGSAARFRQPSGVAVDGAGNVYVADANNHTIRKVTPAGVVTTVAGLALTFGNTDGTGSAARFNGPRGIVIDSTGLLFVADTNNSRIRQMTADGVVTTLAGVGIGEVDGTGTAARFNGPWGIAVDSAGTLYVADTTNDTIRKITTGAVVTTIAGFRGSLGFADGYRINARFARPNGVAVAADGTVYVADTFNNTIRKITSVGIVTTLAGLAGSSGSTDGTGSAARFFGPRGVAVDNTGVVYVTDANNQTIRKITPAGVVTTLAGLAGSSGSADGAGNTARFNQPSGIAVDSAGTLFVTDGNNHTIRMVTAAGVASTIAGTALMSGSADGTGSAARFNFPRGIAVDSTGTLYVADTNNQTIRKITSGGVVTTLAGAPTQSGNTDATGSAARFSNPNGVAADGAGNLFVADSSNHTIRNVTAAGIVTTYRGSAGWIGALRRFNSPVGIAADAQGFIYVADTANNVIRTTRPLTQPSADFDSDAKTDVAIFRPSTGTWFVLNSSNGSYSAHNWGAIGDVPVPADYDGDGTVDVAIFRPSLGQWWIKTSSSGYSSYTSRQWGQSGDIPLPQDVDGDFKADFFIYRPSTNTFWILVSSSNYTQYFSFQWGTPGDVPAIGDYDGDGDLDATVFRPSTGQWFIVPSTDEDNYLAITWGTSTDKLVQADYDGDGRTDIAVYRPSSGTWFVLTSSSNFTSSLVRNWGVGSDIPVPGDYDGDRKADMAIFRPSAGTWFILTSSSNFTAYLAYAWGIGTDLPILQR